MKKTKLTLALAALVLTSAVTVISSCKKSTTTTTTTPPDSDVKSAQDNNLAEQHANDAFSMAGQASENGSVSYRLGGNQNVFSVGCASATPGTGNSLTSGTYTITFNGSICLDGKIRSGELIMSYSNGPFRNPGFSCTIASAIANPYVVDGYTVAISKNISNITPTPITVTSQMTWSVNATLTITKPSSAGGGTITWNCSRTHVLLNSQSPYTIGGVSEPACYTNASTPINWLQAVMQVNGTANGTSGSANYSATANNLIRNMNCSPDANYPAHHPFVEGSIDFTPSGKATRHIDFGTGTCDLLYTVSISGVTYGPYTLP
jgi:hypothetical protein